MDIDMLAGLHYSLDGRTLMENAGFASACLAREMIDSEGDITIFCGGGRNGGDGIVAARHLLSAGFFVNLVLLCPSNTKSIPAEIGANLEALGYPYKVSERMKVIDIDGVDKIMDAYLAVSKSCLVIDALLGTGIKGEPQGFVADCIRVINSSGKKVLSLDIPSGCSSDDGSAPELSVKADATITFCALKQGLLAEPTASLAGKLFLSRIGLPDKLLNGLKGELLDIKLAGSLIPRRQSWFHKGDLGRVGIIAGSVNMPGAAALCAKGALKGGVGLCELFVPQAAYNGIMASGMASEAMIRPLPSKDGWFSGKLEGDAWEVLEEKDAIVIGPGIGRGFGAKDILKTVIDLNPKKLVLDADALWLVEEYGDLVSLFEGELMLTPHPGELKQMMRYEGITNDRVVDAIDCAEKFHACVAHKGPGTVVANRKGNFRIVNAGNSAMATPGSGDVLAGLVGAIAARGADAYSALSAACFIHSLAGDLAAKAGGESILAGDIADRIPEAMEMAQNAADRIDAAERLPYIEITRDVQIGR